AAVWPRDLTARFSTNSWLSSGRFHSSFGNCCLEEYRIGLGRRPKSGPPSPYSWSAFGYEVVNPVLLPALFVILGAERLFFAETDGLDALCGDPALHERLPHRFRAAGAEGDVVFLRSAVVTMALDENLDTRMLREEGAIILDSWRLAGADSGFVVVEEHIFDVLAEQVLIRG